MKKTIKSVHYKVAHTACVVRERRAGFVKKKDIFVSSKQMFLA